MLPLLLALVVTQTPPPLPPATESADATEVRQFVDAHLVSFEAPGWNAKLRQGARTFAVTDDDFATAFSLVPEAHAMAVSLRESYLRGMRLFAIGSVIEAAGAVGLAALVLVATGGVAIAVDLVVALALGCAGVALVGSVVSIVALPDLMRAQAKQFEVVSLYNHGLTRRPAETPSGAVPVLQLGF